MGRIELDRQIIIQSGKDSDKIKEIQIKIYNIQPNDMSHLIEDSLFHTEFSRPATIRQGHNKLQNSLNSHSKTYSYPGTNLKYSLNKPLVPQSTTEKQSYIRKLRNFSLVLVQRKPINNTLQFQAIILLNDLKFSIKNQQKRILFAKQWMKQKQERLAKLSINFKTGELQLYWPEIFLKLQNSTPISKLTFEKTYKHLMNEFVQFFKDRVEPVFKKIFLFQYRTYKQVQQNLQTSDHLETFKPYVEDDIDAIHKYLHMSTIIDSFDKDKESFRRIHDKAVKQTESIIKIQSNIDVSFSKLSNQLTLYSPYTIKHVLASLSNFGLISANQKRTFQQFLSSEATRAKYDHKFQYVLNCIGILKIENKKRFISAGGSSNIYLMKMMFQYIFSDDPKFWIEQNKKVSNNIIEKNFVIKEPKKGSEQKIRHETEIIKRMKGAYSIYLPKYYKVQNSNGDSTIEKNEKIIILDYLRGQTLDVYINQRKDTISFWSKIFLVRNIVNGLRFISNYKIVHLDLKPLNIIVVSELLTKIIDFSESYHPKVCNQSFMPGLTLPYSCPEVFKKNCSVKYDEKCDVFSLGVIMFEIFFGRQFLDLLHSKLHSLYQNKSYWEKVYLCPDSYDLQQAGPIFMVIFQLIIKCLDPIPERRPTLNWISILIAHVLMHFRGK